MARSGYWTKQQVKSSPEEMAQKLKDWENDKPRPILFLGSRTGSLFRLPSFWQLLETIGGGSNLSSMPRARRFRECYQILHRLPEVQQSRQAIIEALLQQNHVGIADVCVAELIKRGIFSVVITTNIGYDLEYALTQADMTNQPQFDIIYPMPDESMYRISQEDIRFKIYKIFGSFSSKEYTIGSDLDYLERYPTIRELFEKVQDRDILIVGFDEMWDRHIQPFLFRGKGNAELWYVNEEEPEENTFLSLSLQEYCQACIFDSIGNYDLFFLNLCWHIIGIIPALPLEKMLQTIQNAQDKAEGAQQVIQGAQNVIQDAQRSIQVGIKALANTVSTRLALSDTDGLLKANSANAPFHPTDSK